jgi:hypothetical protein
VQAAIGTGEVILVGAAAASLYPLAVLLLTLSDAARHRPRRRLATALGPALLCFPRLAILFVAFGLAQAATVGVAAFLAPLATTLTAGAGEARSEAMGVAVAVIFALGVGWLALVHDVARAAVASLRLRPLRALAVALHATSTRAGYLAARWALYGAASWAPVVAVAWAAARIGGGAGAFVALALVHQAVALGRVALRAAWLDVAVRAVQTDGAVAFDGRTLR